MAYLKPRPYKNEYDVISYLEVCHVVGVENRVTFAHFRLREILFRRDHREDDDVNEQQHDRQQNPLPRSEMSKNQHSVKLSIHLFRQNSHFFRKLLFPGKKRFKMKLCKLVSNDVDVVVVVEAELTRNRIKLNKSESNNYDGRVEGGRTAPATSAAEANGFKSNEQLKSSTRKGLVTRAAKFIKNGLCHMYEVMVYQQQLFSLRLDS